MKVAVFNTKSYDREFLQTVNQDYGHELTFLESRLNEETKGLAADFPAVCVFVNDQLNREVLTTLAVNGTRLIALRCAGFNNVDLLAAQELGLTVVRVPAYSPSSVAEHTAGLILALNRKTCRAYNRVKDGNFSLEGLLGFNLQGRVVGIIGTGKIGSVVARIMRGFGCEVLAYDPVINTDCEKIGVAYVDLPELYSRSDIITLHCPLTNASYHMIHEHALGQMKDSVMLINTSRGAVVDTNAVITALKSGKVGYLGLDVYEQEGDLFFEDLSNNIIKDDVFERLLTFPNVVITGHQGFFTRDALDNIAHTTLQNITNFEQNGNCKNEVTPSLVVKSTL